MQALQSQHGLDQLGMIRLDGIQASNRGAFILGRMELVGTRVSSCHATSTSAVSGSSRMGPVPSSLGSYTLITSGCSTATPLPVVVLGESALP